MRRFGTLLLSVLVLVVLYANIDRQALLQHFRQMHLGFFLLSLLCFIPQILVTAWRWCWMVWDVCRMDLWASTKLNLAARAFNAFLPSKLGEASKAYFLKTHADVPLAQGAALVVLEKVLDMAGLCAVLLVGVLFIPARSALETSATLFAILVLMATAGILLCRAGPLIRTLHLIARGVRLQRLVNRLEGIVAEWDTILARWKHQRFLLFGIIVQSVGLWCLHLTQIYLFFLTLRSTVAAQLVLAYVPLGIFVGVLPLTAGGMGTRDSALIYLFAAYESASVMAGIGLLCSMRYWVDTLLGLPLLSAYSFEKTHDART